MRIALLMVSLLACNTNKGGEGESGTADGGDGADGGETEDLDPNTVPLEGACPQETRHGVFEVESNEDYAAVVGEVANAVLPTSVLTELLTEGDCTIWRRENPFCDPGCEPGFTCDLSGACVAYPEAQDLGTVDVLGLSTAVSMQPVTPGNSYFDTSLDNPPWAPRDVVTVRTEGGAYTALTLHGVAPDPFELESSDWSLAPGQPFTVRWTPPDSGSRTEVALKLRIDQHGLTPSSLICVFPDTGEGVVPASAFDALIEFGITGFPAGEIERRTVDSTDLEDGGCAELHTVSARLGRVEIDGYTPCRRDEDCPEGETCNEALERCE